MRPATSLLVGVAAALAAWQGLVAVFAPPAFILPGPLDVAVATAGRWPFLLRHAGVTLLEVGLGLAIGILAGAATAIFVAAFPRLGQFVWPLVLVAQALPVFAIAPLLVVWFGFGLASKIVMTSLIIFFPVASAFGDGLRRADPAILDDVALTTATHWQTLALIRLPLALPSLVSGIRIAAPLAPLGAVVGEWVGASAGLGFIMIQANARMQTADVFAALAILALMSLALRALVDRLALLLPAWARDADDATLSRKS